MILNESFDVNIILKIYILFTESPGNLIYFTQSCTPYTI